MSKEVVAPLENAIRHDPDNAWLRVQLANWYGMLWERSPLDRRMAEQAKKAAEDAERLDPEGGDPCQMRYRLFILFARVSEQVAANLKDKDKTQAAKHLQVARQQYEFAAQTLQRRLPLDPQNPRIRAAAGGRLLSGGGRQKGAGASPYSPPTRYARP